MKLRQVYNEFIRIYLKKENNKIVELDVEDENYSWITDGATVWSIPGENPFAFKKLRPEWFKAMSEKGEAVTKIKRSPNVEAKELIKLETGKEDLILYLDERKLKWFNKGYELRISKEPLGKYGHMCQVYEDGELRGLILGLNVAESRQF